ncbi:hypothetical protein EVAR_79134_1 [Eumeta japonica]|uniref:Uncharacterized protein n=1 Tax=Eumeta variegata TaxID=151549 RepID=A0A4C1UT16_EUMVA|nr:hypothetical protein EVAR_79134_1 [Eumeta japonica]
MRQERRRSKGSAGQGQCARADSKKKLKGELRGKSVHEVCSGLRLGSGPGRARSGLPTALTRVLSANERKPINERHRQSECVRHKGRRGRPEVLLRGQIGGRPRKGPDFKHPKPARSYEKINLASEQRKYIKNVPSEDPQAMRRGRP